LQEAVETVGVAAGTEPAGVYRVPEREPAEMTWLRIEDGFMENPKILQLTDHQFRLWMRILCFCARAKDPTVDELTIRAVPGLGWKRLVGFLDVGLLDRVGGAYEVHDWLKYQPKDPTGASRQARFRARRNALRNGEVTDDDRYRNAPPSRPVEAFPSGESLSLPTAVDIGEKEGAKADKAEAAASDEPPPEWTADELALLAELRGPE